MRNGRVAGDLAVLQGARRENILYGSSTEEQRRSSAKDRQPGGLFSGGRLAALLLSHRALRLCSFVAPCQPASRDRRIGAGRPERGGCRSRLDETSESACA